MLYPGNLSHKNEGILDITKTKKVYYLQTCIERITKEGLLVKKQTERNKESVGRKISKKKA